MAETTPLRAARARATLPRKPMPGASACGYRQRCTTPRNSPVTYVDGFVLPVPKKNLKVYRGIAKKAGRIWREHGALEYRECVGDDLDVKMGVPFPRMAKVKPGETVVFSWIVYKSRGDRDRVNKKVMKDKRIAAMMDPKAMPFDAKRMIYGGFKTMVEASS